MYRKINECFILNHSIRFSNRPLRYNNKKIDVHFFHSILYLRYVSELFVVFIRSYCLVRPVPDSYYLLVCELIRITFEDEYNQHTQSKKRKYSILT